jgi:hypothetical protein
MWKILKGKGKKQVLDSTHTDKRKANARLKTLRATYQHSRIELTLVEADEEDPINYKRPTAGPYTNYEPERGATKIPKGKRRNKPPKI